jgi:hypothetical protein
LTDRRRPPILDRITLPLPFTGLFLNDTHMNTVHYRQATTDLGPSLKHHATHGTEA